MAQTFLSPDQFEAFYGDVMAGIMEEEGAPKNFEEALTNYDVQIPDLSEKYNDEFLTLIQTDFAVAQSGSQKWHCEVCAVCALCILCGELNAGVGAGAVSGIFAIFNNATA